MAFVSSQKSRLLLGDFSLSGFLKSVSVDDTADVLDSTVFTDTAKTFVVGQNSATLTLSGLLDSDAAPNAQFDQLNDWKAATTPEPLSAGFEGMAVGSQLWMAGALETQFTIGATVDGLVTTDLAAVTSGGTDLGVSLHDLGAETADGNAANVDNGAATTNGGVGHLHVTAFSGLSSADIIIEGSANGSTGWATLVTFAQVAGITSQRVEITGSVHRYVRCTIDVTGTGSVTYQCGFARR